MTPERWRKIERLIEAAEKRSPEQRAAFLDQACQGDDELRREVEWMLAHQNEPSSFLQAPAREFLAKMLDADREGSLAGMALGPYQELTLIGTGGMGEVYAATDIRLDRKVAIKKLPSVFANDPGRIDRLQHEAKLLASLNHPNIAAIYELEDFDGVRCLVMEFVPGLTLAERLESGPMRIAEALRISIQIAEALEAAHAKGIIHRDLKPANIKVTPEGKVKVLDFGLAKALSREGTGTDLSRSSATTESRTQEGTIVGSPSYMSPEQVQGKTLDRRTDIFSFGAVLYEMITGRRAFEDETVIATLTAVLHKEPAPMSNVPPDLDKIVARCLRKDSSRRFQDIADVKILLSDLKEELERMVPTPATPNPSRRLFWASLSVFLAVAATLLLWFPRKISTTRQPVFVQVTNSPAKELHPSLSPDDSSIVYASDASGNWDIYLQRIGGMNAINLTKDSADNDTDPAFSPSGDQIAFHSDRSGGGIFLMGATGESVRRLTGSGYDPDWSPDGKQIVYATEEVENRPQGRAATSRLWVVEVTNGEKRQLTQTDGIQPRWSPHGYRIAYAASEGGQRDIWTIASIGGKPVPVTHDLHVDWSPAWSPDGNYLYFASDRGGTMNMWRVGIDENSGETHGEPIPLTTPSPYSGQISVARKGGRIAYVQWVDSHNLQKVRFDPETETVLGEPVSITDDTKPHYFPDPSPDGRWLTFCSFEKPEDIFVIAADGSGLRQLTDDPFVDRFPRWSPDGNRILFMSDRTGKYEMWLINRDGSGLRQLTFTSGEVVAGGVWSPDGLRVVYNRNGSNPAIIEVDKPWKDQQPVFLPPPEDPKSTFWARRWSSDGRWLTGFAEGGAPGVIIYSLESKKYEKIVPFYAEPVWLKDSRRLLLGYRNGIWIVDRQTQKYRLLRSMEPFELDGRLSTDTDDRTIYLTVNRSSADIWLINLGGETTQQ